MTRRRGISGEWSDRPTPDPVSYIPDVARRCATRGAALLDKSRPHWWPSIVTLDALDSATPDLSVLGQVYDNPSRIGGHHTGLALLNLLGHADKPVDDRRGPAHYGFTLPRGAERPEAWAVLDDAW